MVIRARRVGAWRKGYSLPEENFSVMEKFCILLRIWVRRVLW